MRWWTLAFNDFCDQGVKSRPDWSQSAAIVSESVDQAKALAPVRQIAVFSFRNEHAAIGTEVPWRRCVDDRAIASHEMIGILPFNHFDDLTGDVDGIPDFLVHDTAPMAIEKPEPLNEPAPVTPTVERHEPRRSFRPTQWSCHRIGRVRRARVGLRCANREHARTCRVRSALPAGNPLIRHLVVAPLLPSTTWVLALVLALCATR
jgi:hypothetical protein